MNDQKILIVGGGIGGLTAAIALGGQKHDITIAEKDPNWAVYGVGIIQQSNVVRAMSQLGIIEDYLAAGFGFDWVEIFVPTGEMVARMPVPVLVEGLPGNVGITRTKLHEVLGARAKQAGASVRLGLTVESFDDDGDGVDVAFSDGSDERFDLVIGADGLYSKTRAQIFPNAQQPQFTGQAVWRYNLPRDEGTDCIQIYEGTIGAGVVPLSDDLMYMFVTTAEPGNPRYPREGLAAAMRTKVTTCGPRIRELAGAITQDDEVVYKPLEWILLEQDWHKGRIGLLGDAVHATTPHLAQGAGLAIEDAIVLAEEIQRHDTPESAFKAFRKRRFERCRYVVQTSLALCRGQLGEGPLLENKKVNAEAFAIMAAPI